MNNYQRSRKLRQGGRNSRADTHFSHLTPDSGEDIDELTAQNITLCVSKILSSEISSKVLIPPCVLQSCVWDSFPAAFHTAFCLLSRIYTNTVCRKASPFQLNSNSPFLFLGGTGGAFTLPIWWVKGPAAARCERQTSAVVSRLWYAHVSHGELKRLSPGFILQGPMLQDVVSKWISGNEGERREGVRRWLVSSARR